MATACRVHMGGPPPASISADAELVGLAAAARVAVPRIGVMAGRSQATGLARSAAVQAIGGSSGFVGFAVYNNGGTPVTGGTGGTVMTVNNVTEFRTALTTTGTRIIRFGTGGTYALGTSAVQAKGNLTIDGSTAPSRVTITGYMIQWSGAGNGNVIVQDITHRGSPSSGTENENGENMGGINGATGFVFLRCSFSGNLSEALGFWRGASWVSVIECIFGQGSYTGESRGILFGNNLAGIAQYGPTQGLSCYRTIFHNILWRAPAMGYWDSGENGAQFTGVSGDVANCLIWAPNMPSSYGVVVYQGARANVRYNYMYTNNEAVLVSQSQAYCIGNYSRNGKSVSGNLGSAVTIPAAAVLPFTTNAQTAAASVLTTAGCRIGGLDSFDQAIINEINAAGL